MIGAALHSRGRARGSAPLWALGLLACASAPDPRAEPPEAPASPALPGERGPLPSGEARLPARAPDVVEPGPAGHAPLAAETASAEPRLDPEGPRPQALVFPDEPFRATQPPPGPPRPFRLPGVTRFLLDPHGVEVFLVERRTLPTVTMTMVFPGGSAADPRGLEGRAELCMQLHEEGTRSLDKLAFAEALADLASTVSAWASTDELGLSFSALTRNLEATADLWADMLLEPGLRAADLERLVRRRSDALKQQKAAVASVAARLAGFVTYGPSHALGRLETEASYAAVSVKACEELRARWLKPRGARLFVVGDIDAQGLRDVIGTRLARGGLRGAPPAPPALGRAAPVSGRIFFTGIPDAAQSAVQILHPGPPRRAPDYVATTLMTGVLGGGFSGRLNMNLREDKGWSYGARGGFSYHRLGSTFSASAAVKAEHTADAVREMLREMRALADGSAAASDAEVAREKDGTILALPAGFATGAQVLGQYRALVYFGLPLDYYDRFVQAVAAARAEEIARAARVHLRPEAARVLVAGDPARVLPQLRELLASGTLPAGDLVVLDADGQVQDREPGPGAAPRRRVSPRK